MLNHASEAARFNWRASHNRVREHKVKFSGSLRNVCALADLKMNRMLGGIDQWIDDNGHGTALSAGISRLASTLSPARDWR